MIELLTNFIIAIIKATGYPGVFVLMTLESALVPIPSEATMPFAGSLVSPGIFNFWLLVMIGTAGNLLGSLLAYGLGYLGENEVADFIRRYGKYVLVREKEFEHARVLFNRFGEPIVFISRILPAVRTYISLPAGIAKMDLKKFVFYTAAGSFIWAIVLTYLGVILGNNWHLLSKYFHILDFVVIGGIVLAVLYLVLKRLKKI
ncbi:DedA family protein [Patescibacteria group bacterium]|nr:DedA family protein [Patescibacteria group bacterium]